MSRRAMILLILAIIAVHGILLWLVVATGSNEQKIADTRKQIAEENALRSEMEDEIKAVERKDPASTIQEPDTGASVGKPETGTAQGASAQPKPSTAQTSGSTSQTSTTRRPYRPRPTSASRKRWSSRNWISRARHGTIFPG